jgi:hypothetical protein
MLNGKWKGTYTYGKSYGDSLSGKTVAFVMDLKILNGQVSGYCQDIGEIEEAFEKPAEIEGTFEQGKIFFTKKYPGLLVVDEKNYYAYSDVPAADLTYQGTLKTRLFSRKKYFKGIWNLKSKFFTEDEKEQIVENKGIWKMQKDT